MVEFIQVLSTWFATAKYGLLAILIGVVAASAELLTRYNYDYRSIWGIRMSWIYMLINGFSGLAAYYFIVEFNILATKDWIRAFVAGTSALLILRSSFLNLKMSNDKQLDVGISSILQIFLHTASRSFSQERSINRLGKMDFMKNVDFDKAKTFLPTLCCNIMNASKDEREIMIAKITDLDKSSDPNESKSVNLGIILAELTEINLLKKAVEMMGDSIKFDIAAAKPLEPLDDVLNRLSKDESL